MTGKPKKPFNVTVLNISRQPCLAIRTTGVQPPANRTVRSSEAAFFFSFPAEIDREMSLEWTSGVTHQCLESRVSVASVELVAATEIRYHPLSPKTKAFVAAFSRELWGKPLDMTAL